MNTMKMTRQTAMGAAMLCMALILATVAFGNTWGFSEPISPAATWGFAPDENELDSDITTMQRATPDWSQVFAQDACPGGVCPTCPQPSTVTVYRPAPIRTMVARGATWTWPGNLGNHLASEHGIDTSGMSHAEMVAVHDSLHNGQTMGMGVFNRSASRGYGIFRHRHRPLGWRFRPFLRMRMGW